MATLEQLSAALVKADAAGNADDARALAAEIRKMRGSEPAPETTIAQDIKQGAGNLAAGLVRGAGSIGATLVAPWDMAKDAINGKGLSLQSNRERRADMDSALGNMGAETDSWMYQGGKLAGEIAGTAGAGGLVAQGVAKVAPGASSLTNAIATGGFKAGAKPGLANILTRGTGGAVNGGVSAALVNPEDFGAGASIGALLPGAAWVAGSAGNLISKGVEKGANRLMQSAIKPTIAQLKSGDSAVAVKTLLERGINPSAAGVNKLRGLIDDVDNQIGTAISGSTAVIDKQSVLNRLAGTRASFGNQVSPTSDLAAIQGVADDFLAHPGLTGSTLPVQAAQDMKRGTYKVLEKKFGQMGSAEVEAQKALARGLKEEVAAAVPGVQGMNDELGKLITTLKVSERRALMEMNKNPMGLAALANNPASWAMFMADKSALFKSLAARAMNASSGGAAAAGGLIGASGANPALRNAFLLPAAAGD